MRPTEHTVTGLTNGTLYTYQVRAVKGTLKGEGSTEAGAVAGPSRAFTLTRNGSAVTQLTENGATATATIRITNTVRFTSDQTIELEWGGRGLGDTRLTGAGGATAITIATGAASGSLVLSISDDERFSPDQTERLTGSYSGGTTGGVDLTIVDDEAPPDLSLILSQTRITEGDRFRIVAEATRGYANVQFLEFATLTGDIAKLTPEDYNAVNSTVESAFLPGSTEGATTIDALDNTTPGDHGEVVFTVPTDNPLFTAGSPSSVTLTILDDDAGPSAPQNLTANAGNARATLEWDHPTSYDEIATTNYQYRHDGGSGTWTSWTGIPGGDAQTTSYTVTGLTNDTTYTFEVRAVNDNHNGTAASVMATPRAHGVSIYPFTITEGESSTITIIPEGAPFTTTKVINVVLASRVGPDQPRKDSDFEVSAPGHPLTKSTQSFSEHGFSGQHPHYVTQIEPGETTVSLTLPGGRACTATGAICGRQPAALELAQRHRERPRRAVVADASAHENTDDALDFVISLDRSSTLTVTVDYATSNGTATAGSDYTATSGTLTFNPGDVTKTVSVPVLDDAIDDGGDTMTFTLSNASNARIADGTATGTIENSDPLQQAWIARFGRTVASEVVAGITDRLATARGGSEVRISGVTLERNGSTWTEAPGDDKAEIGNTVEDARTMTGQELLMQSAFRLQGQADNPGGTAWTAWGRFSSSSFEGEADRRTLRRRHHGAARRRRRYRRLDGRNRTVGSEGRRTVQLDERQAVNPEHGDGRQLAHEHAPLRPDPHQRPRRALGHWWLRHRRHDHRRRRRHTDEDRHRHDDGGRWSPRASARRRRR